MTIELKCCPFCGREAEDELTLTEYVIKCVKCPAKVVGNAENELLLVQDLAIYKGLADKRIAETEV